MFHFRIAGIATNGRTPRPYLFTEHSSDKAMAFEPNRVSPGAVNAPAVRMSGAFLTRIFGKLFVTNRIEAFCSPYSPWHGP